MYQVFLGLMPLPVAPSKITTTVGNRSQTIELIDGAEVNIVKGAKLQEIAFEFLCPSQNYPFMTFAGSLAGSLLGNLGLMGVVTSTAFIEYLEKLKADKEPFQFICVRMGEGFSVTSLSNTNVKVVLEDYTILEDAAANGMDFVIRVRLKQYVPYTTTLYKSSSSGGGSQRTRPK